MAENLSGKRVLLLIGGGIAAYKALDLIRRLRERGASVRVVMTAAAHRFVTPLAAASLSGDKVHDDLFSLTDEAAMGHIELSRDADLLVIAPATADLIGKMANGLAGDLASTLLLATDKKVLAAPAMNVRMWLHPAVRRNVATLRRDGVVFVGPDDGDMACGEFGPGRMAEPLAIVAAIAEIFQGDTLIPLPPPVDRVLVGKTVLVTSGPTHEAIDPVRYIANRSSGKQGHAIALAAARAGGRVTLVSGPVAIPDPPGVRVVHVETAREMLSAVEAALPADIFVAAAAVADWRPAVVAAGKVKKTGHAEPKTLDLVENPDILAKIGGLKTGRPALVVGFAAETDDILNHARAKLRRKNCDLIVANDVTPQNGVMGGERNTVHLVGRRGDAVSADSMSADSMSVDSMSVESWPTLDKAEVGARLVARIARLLAGAEP